jgi:dTDP-4-dehydrorhamnose 3,5-epimerase
MMIRDAPLAGVKIIEPDRFEDDRGWFMEVWNAERYRAAGLDVHFVQSNVSSSRRGVLRGMHFQYPDGQGKLVTVLEGSIFDAVVDVRRGSATFARWYGCELSVDNRHQLWVPEGFAHGFLVLSDSAVVHYNCTSVYSGGADRSLAWNDPAVGIEWPAAPRTISAKDRSAPALASIPAHHLPSADRDNAPARART